MYSASAHPAGEHILVSHEVKAHTEQHQTDLRTWASGDYAAEAGTELLIRAFGGRFATPCYPWVIDGEYKPAIDFEAIEGNLQRLYDDEERRFLLLVASVGQGGTQIDLSKIIPDMDRNLLSLVLAAVAHLGRSSPNKTNDRPSLHDWPTPTQ